MAICDAMARCASGVASAWRAGTSSSALPISVSIKSSAFPPSPLRPETSTYGRWRSSSESGMPSSAQQRGDNATISYEKCTDCAKKEEPLDISTLPLAHLAEGIGRVYARGSWKDDATWFRFECGDWWAEHNHFEAGNFEIFKNEPLATESGEYGLYDTDHSMIGSAPGRGR